MEEGGDKAVLFVRTLMNHPIEESDGCQFHALTAAEQAFLEFLRAVGLMQRVMAPYFAQFDITAAQWGVLRTLHCAQSSPGGGLRLVDLSDRLIVRPPSVTAVVNGLVRLGLVARVTGLDDRRTKHVRLTEKGKALMSRVLPEHPQFLGMMMAGLDEPQQRQLGTLLGAVAAHLQELLSSAAMKQRGKQTGSGRFSGPRRRMSGSKRLASQSK
jgi:DNA-binding MarR family transcriptional regulator